LIFYPNTGPYGAAGGVSHAPTVGSFESNSHPYPYEYHHSSAGLGGDRCPCIRRRLPTESIPPPVKNKKTSASKSQKQQLPVEKHSNHPSESTL